MANLNDYGGNSFLLGTPNADMTMLAVNTVWSTLEEGTPVELDGVTYYYGVNAFAGIAEAIAAAVSGTTTTIKVASDTAGLITQLKNLSLIKADETTGSVSVTNTQSADWFYIGNVSVGKDVNLSCVKIFFKGTVGNTVTVDGSITTSAEAAQGYEYAVTVSETGSLDIAGYYCIRYNNNTDSGLFVTGSANAVAAKEDRTIQLKAGSLDFGSGSISLKNTRAEINGIISINNQRDRNLDEYANSTAALVLDNTYLDVVLSGSGDAVRLNGSSSVTLKDSTLAANGKLVLDGADTALILDNSAVKLDNVLKSSGSIVMDAVSTITVSGVTNTGIITVDMTDAAQYAYKLIDSTGAADYGVEGVNYVFSNDNGYDFAVKDNDLYAAITSLAVKADWSTLTPGTQVEVDSESYIYGTTAFASVTEAAASAVAASALASGFTAMVKVASDTAEDNLALLKNISLIKANEVSGSVNVSSNYAANWLRLDGVTIGENVNLTGQKVFFYGDNGGDVTVNGSVAAAETTQGRCMITVSETGKLNVSGYSCIRYSNAGDGLFVTGTAASGEEKSSRTVQWSCGEIDFRSGVISLKDTRAEVNGVIRMLNSADRALPEFAESSSSLILDNTYLDVTVSSGTAISMDGKSSVSLTNSTLEANGTMRLAEADNSLILSSSEADLQGLTNGGSVSLNDGSWLYVVNTSNDLEAALGSTQNDGVITIDATSTLYTEKLTNSGSITLTMGGVIAFDTISVTQKIALDGFTEYSSSAVLVMDYIGDSKTYTVDAYAELLNIADADKSKFIVVNNDLYYVGAERNVYVNSEYTASSCGGHTWGVDAFDSFTSAKTVNPDKIISTGGLYADSQTASGKDSYVDLDCFATQIDGGTYSKIVTSGERITDGTSRQWVEIGSAQQPADTALTINGGTFNSNVFGSSYIYQNGSLEHIGDVTLTINGGTFKKTVAGGVYYNETGIRDMAILTGDVNLTITGGSFEQRVYGGCLSKTDSLNSALMYVDGTVNLTIDATNSSGITFGDAVLAGSRCYGGVTGGDASNPDRIGTCVTLKGDASKISFSGNALSGGSGADLIYNDGSVSSWVDGRRILKFSGLTGEFDGRLTMFSEVYLESASTVELTADNSRLDLVDSWNAEAGSTLSGIDRNDFTGDTLALTEVSLSGSDSWTVFEGRNTASMTGWDSFSVVSINGADASWEGTKWTTADYELTLDDEGKKLIVNAKLA